MTTIAPPPPAPVGPPPQLAPGGRTALRVGVVAVAAVLLIGAPAGFAVMSVGLSSFRLSVVGQDLPTGMRALTIDTGDAPLAVRITAGADVERPRAELRLVNSTRGIAPGLDVVDDAGGTRLTLRGERPQTPLEWARGGELTVSLPADLARRLSVTAQVRTGAVRTSADLDQLTARTEFGPVILGGDARRVDVHTQDGDIETRRSVSVSESFRADTVNGDITADFGSAAPRSVDAVSRSGDVVIGLPGAGPYLVRTQAGAATTVRVPETGDPAAAAAQVTARADEGDVTVTGSR
jgi:hypothetical protein